MTDAEQPFDLDALETTARAATCGPWTWDDRLVPSLGGMAGEPGVYEYRKPVLEAEHWGECGCRSACTLELNVAPEDRAHIASASPDVVLALVARLRAAESVIAAARNLNDRAQGDPDNWEDMDRTLKGERA
ncbi:hypothetical protein [Microbacterium enclense]|uniref:hypothetical protein n=1 Tax=Microbacterium enclense TaxID=993073 RepID=UPI003F7E9580